MRLYGARARILEDCELSVGYTSLQSFLASEDKAAKQIIDVVLDSLDVTLSYKGLRTLQSCLTALQALTAAPEDPSASGETTQDVETITATQDADHSNSTPTPALPAPA